MVLLISKYFNHTYVKNVKTVWLYKYILILFERIVSFVHYLPNR